MYGAYQSGLSATFLLQSIKKGVEAASGERSEETGPWSALVPGADRARAGDTNTERDGAGRRAAGGFDRAEPSFVAADDGRCISTH